MAAVMRGVISSFRLKNIYNSTFIFNRILPYAALHKYGCLYGSKGQEIKMPSLSPTMTEGTILRWLKKEGDPIIPGDVLCEIQTDKAIVGFEVEEEGVLAKILVPEDTKDVKIGTLIGVMVDSGEDWKNVEGPQTGQTHDFVSNISETAIQGMEIKMPSLSPTMTEGTIVKWLKKEGDKIFPGDVLCEIQTDKAVVGFETEEEGVLAKVMVPEDTSGVQLGTVIAIMVSEGEDWRSVSVAKPEVQEETKHELNGEQNTFCRSKADDTLKMCGPSVRNLLQEYGIKYDVIHPTGPHSIVLKGDVLRYINVNNLKPHRMQEKQEKVTQSSAPDITFIEKQQYVDIPHTNMRHTIAKRLTESKTKIPHVFMSIDCTMNEVTKLRSKMKEEGIAVSVNDFIIKCAAVALKTVPEVNVVWDKDIPRMVDNVDISIAVAIDNGLITPIIKQANTLAVSEISEAVKELAFRAKQNKLKPDEYIGGSFSISNLGMFGISEFTAVINPPQAAILSVGTSRAVLASNKQLETKMTVTLNFDRRVIDEAIAGRFLQCLKQYMEDPVAMLYGSSLKNFGKNL